MHSPPKEEALPDSFDLSAGRSTVRCCAVPAHREARHRVRVGAHLPLLRPRRVLRDRIIGAADP